MRRQEVCLRLREIAFQTGDDDLSRKADELDQKAWEAYRQRISRLPTPTGVMSVDEQTLESGLLNGSGVQATNGGPRGGNQGQTALKGERR